MASEGSKPAKAAPVDDKSEDKSSKKRRWAQQGGQRKKQKISFMHDVALHKGKNLILCSCQKYKERLCGRDLKLQLNEFIKQYLAEKKAESASKGEGSKEQTKVDNTEGKEDGDEDDDLKQSSKSKEDASTENGDPGKTESVSEAVARELGAKTEDDVCEWYQGQGGGLVSIVINAPVKASDLLVWIFEKSTPKRPSLTCWANRLFPCDCTSFSNQEQLIKMAGEVIQKEDWTTIPDDYPYAIDYRNRGNKSLQRNEIYEGIAKFVDDKYPVNLKNPKTVLLLQTFGKNAGFSIIRDGMYAKHQQFNLTKFIE